MAVCEHCGQDMMTAASCTRAEITLSTGETRPAIPAEEGCGDCGVDAGGYHHPWCDVATCPECGTQLISCGCTDTDDVITAILGF